MLTSEDGCRRSTPSYQQHRRSRSRSSSKSARELCRSLSLASPIILTKTPGSSSKEETSPARREWTSGTRAPLDRGSRLCSLRLNNSRPPGTHDTIVGFIVRLQVFHRVGRRTSCDSWISIVNVQSVVPQPRDHSGTVEAAASSPQATGDFPRERRHRPPNILPVVDARPCPCPCCHSTGRQVTIDL